jgi:hypothetical protein
VFNTSRRDELYTNWNVKKPSKGSLGSHFRLRWVPFYITCFYVKFKILFCLPVASNSGENDVIVAFWLYHVYNQKKWDFVVLVRPSRRKYTLVIFLDHWTVKRNKKRWLLENYFPILSYIEVRLGKCFLRLVLELSFPLHFSGIISQPFAASIKLKKHYLLIKIFCLCFKFNVYDLAYIFRMLFQIIQVWMFDL